MNRFERIAEEKRKVTDYLVSLGPDKVAATKHADLIKMILKEHKIAFSEFRLGNLLRELKFNWDAVKAVPKPRKRQRTSLRQMPAAARQVKPMTRTFAERLDAIERNLEHLLHHLGAEGSR